MLMFAGHGMIIYNLVHRSLLIGLIETTGIVLAETLAYLALSPDDQSKAHSEILQVISNRDPVRISCVSFQIMHTFLTPHSE